MGTLCNFSKLLLSVALFSLVAHPEISNCLALFLPKSASPISEALCSTRVLSLYLCCGLKTLSRQYWGKQGFNLFVSPPAGIIILHCLMSSVLKSLFCFVWPFSCFMLEGKPSIYLFLHLG